MQEYLDSRLLATVDTKRRDELSWKCHDRGYYWYAVLIHLDTLHRFRHTLDAEEMWGHRESILSSAAGIRGAQNLPFLVIPRPNLIRRPKLQVNFANLEFSRGHQQSGSTYHRNAVELWDSLPPREKEKLLPALLRRRAQLTGSVHDAREALVRAETKYSENTALVQEGVLGISKGELAIVEEASARLDERHGTMSWLYEAENLFLKGVSDVLGGPARPGDVYTQLTIAQYIYVILGLQMAMSPELNLPAPPGGRSWDWTPSDVLRSVFAMWPAARQLGRPECYALRREHIWGKNVYERLLDPLCGWPPWPAGE